MGPFNNDYSKREPFPGIFFVCMFALFVCAAGCGGLAGNLTSVTPPSPTPNLTSTDVMALVQAATQAADPTTVVIAVVDRAGNILAVYRKPAAPTFAAGNFGVQVDANELAVSLARTAAFFSNDQAPLSSRTVRFLSGIHFPPGVSGATNAALVAYEAERRPATTDLVMLNRRNGPEQVMQLVEERAPAGFNVVTDVLSLKELEDIAANYKRVAGFQVEGLNAKPPIVAMPASGQLSSAG